MIASILVIVLPVFLVAAAGWLAAQAKLMAPASVDGLMIYTQKFAIPCLLFSAIAGLDLGAVFLPGMMISYYTGAAISFTLGILGARYIFGRRPGESVAIGFGALFSNAVLLGLPVMERAYGPDALAPMFALISIHAPFCYVLGITVMEMARSDGRGLVRTARAMLQAIFSNALMIGLALGFLVNLSGLPIPGPAAEAIDLIADSALPAALFGLGAVLSRYSLRASLPEAGMITTLSLMVHPAITWFLASRVFDLSEGFVRAAVVMAAMAPGVNAYIFASLYGRGQPEAASAVLLATAVSVLSASFWLALLGGVG